MTFLGQLDPTHMTKKFQGGHSSRSELSSEKKIEPVT